jgi:hypothetical protein
MHGILIPYPWYIDLLTHGILTPIHGMSKGVEYTMDKGFDIPWVGGQNNMARG